MASRNRVGGAFVATLLVIGALAGCSAPDGSPTGVPASSRPVPSASATTRATPSGEATPPPAPAAEPVEPTGEPARLATGLRAPWSIVFAGDSALISERDTARVLERTAPGEIRAVGEVPGVVPGGEGGLLGLAVWEDAGTTWLYAYTTTASDNRIVRMPLTGAPGSFGLGPQEVLLEGIAKAGNHNGGRLAFGPDGALWATAGDAGRPERAQDPESLNGKILRMTPDGGPAAGNPFAGSVVYSLGHRNPQGITWDASGQAWAAEFGQDTWDEMNRLSPGANYGWPVVEGVGGREGFVDPVYQWPTSEASPSGLAFTGGTFFLAALRGQRLWTFHGEGQADAREWFAGEFGRIRDVAVSPAGTLWMVTSNTDRPRATDPDDDLLLEVRLAPVSAG